MTSNKVRRQYPKWSLVVTLVLLCLGGATALFGATSVNVALIGSQGVLSGGFLPTTGADVATITFTNLAPANVTAANLAAFDTAVLNVASPEMGCTTGTLSAAAKSALVAFVNGSHKLIIVDSECPSADYTWLPFPFTTNNPGPAGMTGAFTVTEDSTLASPNPASASYIDAVSLGGGTDAVGDANVMVTRAPQWCQAAAATNANNVKGTVIAYAITGGGGIIIYNGLDFDVMPAAPATNGPGYLRKTYALDLAQTFNPAGLPCSTPVASVLDAFQLKYFNTNYGSGQITISNAGSASTGNNPADDSSGTICANLYSFDPNEEMQTCCSCPVTPNGLSSVSINDDIIAQNLIVNPSSAITVKVLYTLKSAQNNGGTCDPTAPASGSLTSGGLAWGTNMRNVTFQGSPPTAVRAVTETKFASAELSAAELSKLTTYCRFIKILGSSVSGICKSCQPGARGAIAK